MSIFDDDGDIFLSDVLGAESIHILPDGVTAREVKAFVVRLPPAPSIDGRTLQKQVQIRLANDVTTGLALSELVLGTTRVRVSPERIGGTTKDLLVEIPDDRKPWNDEGMLRLLAR